MKKFNYTYQITELSSGMKYIGVRTSKIEPSLDLGVYYFSSSSNKKFISDQKENVENYKYEILAVFDNRVDAANHEIELHEQYNVCRSKEFYNRASAGSSLFDMTGKIVVRLEDGKTTTIDTDDIRYLSGELTHHSKGHVDREQLSEMTRKRWEDDYEGMKEKIHNSKSNSLRGKAQSVWISDNPEKHRERMSKINKNPEKIRKAAEAHTGMKRSDENKENMSAARIKVLENSSEKDRAKMTGKGMRYITNVKTWKRFRVDPNYILKENEQWGMKRRS